MQLQLPYKKALLFNLLSIGPFYTLVYHYKVSCLIEESVMFSSRRRGVDQAFRNNQQLQQFVLTDVTATEKVLGTGSYGSVVEV